MRVRPALIHKAATKSRFLPLVLAGVKDFGQAEQELSWLKGHFSSSKALTKACWLRSHNYPLQYLLGSQPFLSLEILCKKGVLIPRWETEEWCLLLISAMKKHNLTKNLNVIDLCTGTGCIGLSLASIISNSKIIGVDKSPVALKCFNENIQFNKTRLNKNNKISIHGIESNVLDPESTIDRLKNELGAEKADIVVANPPYISPDLFDKDCERSVRSYEPRTALIGGNEFYKAILDITKGINADAVVCEVGDHGQMDYVRDYAQEILHWSTTFHLDSTGKARVVIAWNPETKWKCLANISKHFNILEQEVECKELS